MKASFKQRLQFIWHERRKPSREALTLWLGKRARRQLQSTCFIGVTGSAGKSTCVALLHHLLASRFITAASLLENTPRILAKRVTQLAGNEAYAVMEMSGHMPGVLAQSCDVVRPHIGVVLSVSNDHYANFRGVENTIREKSTLVRRTDPSGLVFLNIDDAAVAKMESCSAAQVVSFGQSTHADYRAEDARVDRQGWLSFNCRHASESIPFRLPLPALHFMPSVLAAIAVAHQSGLRLADLADTAADFQPLLGRCSLHPLPSGGLLICDTAKAPYSTLVSAFAILEQFPSSRFKRIVLGNVSDYPGSWSPKLKKIVAQALTVSDQIILHAPPPSSAVDRLRAQYGAEKIRIFESLAEIADYLGLTAKTGEVVLLKSSQVNHLESLLLPLSGQASCPEMSCKLRQSCFNCSNGMANDVRFQRYVASCRGLVH